MKRKDKKKIDKLPPIKNELIRLFLEHVLQADNITDGAFNTFWHYVVMLEKGTQPPVRDREIVYQVLALLSKMKSQYYSGNEIDYTYNAIKNLEANFKNK